MTPASAANAASDRHRPGHRASDSRAANHRLRRLARIGVGEIAYRKGRKFLTIVTDHDTGHVVWVREGRTQKALITFLDTLGPAGRERISAISMDMTRIYRKPPASTYPKRPSATTRFT
jgi:transposase